MVIGILGLTVLRSVIPVAAVIIFIVWHVRKLNSVERTVHEILDKLKEND